MFSRVSGRYTRRLIVRYAPSYIEAPTPPPPRSSTPRAPATGYLYNHWCILLTMKPFHTASLFSIIIFFTVDVCFAFVSSLSTYCVSRSNNLYATETLLPDDENDDRIKQSGRRNLILTSLLMPILQINVKSADAACLPGDIREECIGVYKMPIDDKALPYVESPEKLKLYAPDLNWVPPIESPSNYQTAINQLREQRQRFDAVQEKVAKGNLAGSGLILLDIVPKVTAACRYILKALNNAANNERNKASDSEEAKVFEMKAYRIEYALNELLGYLGETDVLLGQALRGELGVSAPAQIQILSQLGDTKKEFDELLRIVPEKL